MSINKGLLFLDGIGAWPLGRRDVTQVATQCVLQQELVCIRTINVDTTHHLVFRSPGLILGITLGMKCLDGGRPTAFTDDRLPCVRRGLADGGHGVFRFVGVPNDQGNRKG